MNADEREEITASVAAHAELGPKYDSAVAEGLVERIGEEIDRRVDARLRGMGQSTLPRQAYPPSPGHQIVPPGYHGQQAAAQTAALAPSSGAGVASASASAAASAAPSPEGVRRSNGVTGMFLGLGSMGLGVGATAVVVSHHVQAGAEVIIILLIWLFITVINVAHAQRR